MTEVYSDKEKIIFVMDNLNIHIKDFLYQAFPAAEAAALTDRLEIHYIPKHGNWLNIAESDDTSVFGRKGEMISISCVGSYPYGRVNVTKVADQLTGGLLQKMHVSN